MKLHAALALSAFTLFGCGPHASEDGPDESSAAIIGGTTDNGDPSVVALFAQVPGASEGALCTASVIAPTVLVTAAHCVDPVEVGTGAEFAVLLGTDANDSGDTVLAVKETHFDSAFDANAPQDGHDIGIVILKSPTTLAPLPFNKSTSDGVIGSSVRAVGYGLSSASAQTGAGTKRSVTVPVDLVTSTQLGIGKDSKGTCNGDSGGPAFATIDGVATIVGLTSYGNSACTGTGYDTRIDAYASFIAKYVTSSSGDGSSGSASTAGKETEPNGTSAEANTISDGAIDGTLSPTGDVDWFKLTVSSAKTYIVDLAAARASSNIRVYKQAASGSLSSVGVGAASGPNGDRILTKKSAAGGTYYVRVEDDGKKHSDSGAYTLTVQLQ